MWIMLIFTNAKGPGFWNVNFICVNNVNNLFFVFSIRNLVFGTFDCKPCRISNG